MDAPRWSVVIPVYNDGGRLAGQLRRALEYFDGRGEPYEILVVDDGSTDGTSERARQAAGGHPAARILTLPAARGKGFAVREGMLRARGALRLMADADGATPIAAAERLEAALAGGADIAVGRRVPAEGRPAAAPPPARALVAAAFHLVARAAGVRGVRDTQSGFKLFRGAVAEALFEALQTDGYGFDVELILRAQRRGYRVVEVPVPWSAERGFRAGAVGHGPRMLAEVVKARWRLARHPSGPALRRPS